MTARRLVLALIVALFPWSAFAQLDDLLSPLTNDKEDAKHKSAHKKKPAPKAKEAKKGNEKEKEPEKQKEDDLLAPLVPVKGDALVKVSGPADGTQITIDNQPVKAGQKVSLDAGEHTVVVKRPGYSDFSKKITVNPNQVTEVAAQLDAVAGVLSVTSDVANADVMLDGKSIGSAPVRGVIVAPGMHEVVVRRDGFEDSVNRISVRAGKDYTVAGSMKPKTTTTTIVATDADRPERTKIVPDASGGETNPLGGTDRKVESDDWYKRWYVWAGAGAVVVAAATTAVVASSSSHSSKLTPDEVCDPVDHKAGSCADVINAPSAILRLGAGVNLRF